MHAFQFLASGYIRDKSQGYRFYRVARIASNDGFTTYSRLSHKSVDVDACDGIDSVDRRDTISSSAFCGERYRDHVGYIRRELCKYRKGCSSFGSSCEPFHHLRRLADRDSQIIVFHVRTGEVAFYNRCTGPFTFSCEIGPFLLVLTHYRGDYHLRREFPPQFFKYLHILFDAVVGKLLYVLESAECV